MNVFYIHGFLSYPKPEKVQLIEERGHTVITKHFDFPELGHDAFETVCAFAEENPSIDFIVGSSMGGYMGYWLGQLKGIPQLLFNPAIPLSEILGPVPKIEEKENLKSWVALGAQDDTVPPELNLDFFKKRPNARVLVCQWMAHKVDLQTFDEMLAWAGL